MKTTRVLGFVAGVIALVALVFIGASMTMEAMQGLKVLLYGVGVFLIALLTGIAHLLLRIKFRNPYRSRRGTKPFLKAGRVMVWVWGVSMIATVAMVAYFVISSGLGPILLDYLAK
jgi:hypothetical protein